MDFSLDRECVYLGVVYQIIEVLSSNMLLVVPKKEYDKGKFPLTPLIIPGS
jgi:hypothetical protein